VAAFTKDRNGPVDRRSRAVPRVASAARDRLVRTLQGEVCITVVVESGRRRESVETVTGVALAAIRAGGELITVRALVTLCTPRLGRQLERC